MPRAKTNGIEIEYETIGDPAGEPTLLVGGLGCQLLDWRLEFCELLAERGRYVIRFDNRDIGLSGFIDGGPEPDMAAVMSGDHSTVPYLIADMAADAAGLLDALGIRSAHIAGFSMGGMIVQQLAIDFPAKVRSLTSIMSSPGDGVTGKPTRPALEALLTPVPEDREAAVATQIGTWRTIGSPEYPQTDAELRARIEAGFARSPRRDGFARQFAAIQASPDRTPGLREVRVPTLVLHGEADPLIKPSGGEATAAAVPGAQLRLFPGMGHDFPRPLWPAFIEAMASL
jgi:pimeloyl-ACP methyl ester carboxylesterase